MVKSYQGTKPDSIFKEFWQDNHRFASLFNTVMFGGKEVIRSENLQETDTGLSGDIESKEYRETITRTRDVVKKAAFGSEFVILGLESQKAIHYAMPLRTMLYDGLGYLKEYRQFSRQNRDSAEKLSSSEFLSGMKKANKLQPIVSIVVYYGEKPWDGPVSLKDMLAEAPDEIANVVSDYRMNLIQIRGSGKYFFDNEDVQTVFEVSEYIFGKQFDELERKYGQVQIKAEIAAMIGAVTGSDHIVSKFIDKGGGMKMNMCSALRELEQRGLQQGIEQGIERSIRNLMDSTGMAVEEAMDALKIVESERSTYMERLKA